MPGNPNRSRRDSTSGVMTPRFSATKGRRSVFNADCTASKSAAPGPFTHSPRMAVGASAGTSHDASKPRK